MSGLAFCATEKRQSMCSRCTTILCGDWERVEQEIKNAKPN